MKGQVFKKILILSILFTSITTFFLIQNKLPEVIFQNYIYYLLAKGFTAFDQPYHIITILNNPYQAIDIVNNKLLLEQINFTKKLLISSSLKAFYYNLIFISIIILAFIKKEQKLSKTNIIKGTKPINPILLKTKISLLDNFLVPNIKIADIPYPIGLETKHTLITGTTGVGKTVLLSDIITQIRNSKTGKAIIYDKMGVYTKRFYDPRKGDILLNPLDQRFPKNYNITNEINHNQDYTADLIAKAFIPANKYGDPFWDMSAREVLAQCLIFLKNKRIEAEEHQNKNTEDNIKNNTTNKEENNDKSAINYQNITLKDIFFSGNIIQANTIFKEIVDSSLSLQKILSDSAEKTSASILAVVATYLKSMRYFPNVEITENNDHKPFSISNWIQDENQTGFLIIPSIGNQHEALTPIISTFIEIAVNNLLSLNQSQTRRIWFILDELPSLNYIPSLLDGLAQSRQFGGSFILTLQSLSQLNKIYHQDDTNSITDICNTKIIFRANNKQTAQYSADSLGGVKLSESKEGFSYGSHEMRDGVSLHRQEKTQNIIDPLDIMDLKDLNFFLKMGTYPVTKTKMNIKHYEETEKPLIEREKTKEKSIPVNKQSLNNKKDNKTSNNKTNIVKNNKKIQEFDLIS